MRQRHVVARAHLAMGTAMLLPWGAGPQSVSVALGVSAVAVNLSWTAGASADASSFTR